MVEMFDLLVIGAGSGGLAAARRAAKLYGKRVALIESSTLLGGTCVNRGCVPKKIMYNAASLLDSLGGDIQAYGISNKGAGWELNWPKLVADREAYLDRLNEIYTDNLTRDGVHLIRGKATFKTSQVLTVQLDPNSSNSDTIETQAPHIVIATGSYSIIPKDTPGSELGITSDGFFKIHEKLPRKVGIIGSGYVGVELAGILHALGSDVTLWCRKEGVLTHFDSMISKVVTTEMQRIGITINSMSSVSQVAKHQDGTLRVCFQQENQSKECHGYDCLIWAIGRSPNVQGLGLEKVGVSLDHKKQNCIITDAYQNTTVPGVYAIGDVDGRMPLTPVAIAAGRRLIDRLFGGQNDARLDYQLIPTVVFSHPSPCGAIGIPETEARKKYGDHQIKVYETSFKDLYYALHKPADKAITHYKIVCVGHEERIVGLHIIGRSSDEILQGFGVAIRMGATKKDFDNCVAIHPTAAEELVTLK